MDLIKNLTLYDLLGYTFPGVILLEVIQFHIDVFGKISVDGILAGILGFVMGIVMAEFMDFIVTAVRGIHRRIRSRNHKLPDAGPLQKCCETIGITREINTFAGEERMRKCLKVLQKMKFIVLQKMKFIVALIW